MCSVHQGERSSLFGSTLFWGWSFIPTRKPITGTDRLTQPVQVGNCSCSISSNKTNPAAADFWISLEKHQNGSPTQNEPSEHLTFQGEAVSHVKCDSWFLVIMWCSPSFVPQICIISSLPPLCATREISHVPPRSASISYCTGCWKWWAQLWYHRSARQSMLST